MLVAIIQAKIPFTNNTHEPVAYVYWEESITHNNQIHSALANVAKEMLLQSRASAWCASTMHFTLGLCSVCQRNFCLDCKYAVKIEHGLRHSTNRQTNRYVSVVNLLHNLGWTRVYTWLLLMNFSKLRNVHGNRENVTLKKGICQHHKCYFVISFYFQFLIPTTVHLSCSYVRNKY